MSVLSLAIAFGIPLLAGTTVMRLARFRFREDPLAWCGWTFPAGALVTAIAVMAWMACGISATSAGLPVLLVLFSIAGHVLAVRWIRRRPTEEPPESPDPRWLGRVAIALTILCFLWPLYAMVGDAANPVHRDGDVCGD